jgi:hypothetical protein
MTPVQGDRIELGSGWVHRSGRSAVVVSISRTEDDYMVGLLIDGEMHFPIPASCLTPSTGLGGLLDGWSPA